MKRLRFLLLFCVLALLSSAGPLFSATLTYQLSGTVQTVDRATPPSLVGALASMTLSYDTDSLAIRAPYADFDVLSVLADGLIEVRGQAICTYSRLLLFENPTQFGSELMLASDAGFGTVFDGSFAMTFPLFSQFQPDGSLFPGIQVNGNVARFGVIFSTLGLPAGSYNEFVEMSWNSITLIPEPSAAALCAVAAALALRRRAGNHWKAFSAER